MLPVLHFDTVRRPAAAVGSIIDRAPACLRSFYCGDPRDAGHDGLLSWRVLHAPISVNRSAAEFGVASSDQGRPQSPPRPARLTVAPPSSSRPAVPRLIF